MLIKTKISIWWQYLKNTHYPLAQQKEKRKEKKRNRSNYRASLTNYYGWPWRPNFHTASYDEGIRDDKLCLHLLIRWMATLKCSERPQRSPSPAAMSDETESSQLKVCTAEITRPLCVLRGLICHCMQPISVRNGFTRHTELYKVNHRYRAHVMDTPNLLKSRSI